MSGRGGKAPPRGRRPATATREPRGRVSRKSRSRKVSDVPEEEPVKEEPAPTVPLHRQDSWWYHLPPVEKPDEELHIQLVKERHAAVRVKHMEHCRKELIAIFNFAMYQAHTATPDEMRDRELERAKKRFLEGFYDEREFVKTVSDTEEVITTARKLQKSPVIRKLLHMGMSSVAETMLALSRSTSAVKPSIEFDANPEMDRLLKVITQGRGPYVTDIVPEKRVTCPFLICVVGPPCTGKSTVCEFLTKFFNLMWIEVGDPAIEYEHERRVVVDYWDDKMIIPRIVEEVSKLEEGMGAVLGGYPYTRGQLIQLEKALAMANRKKTGCRFTGVTALIRTVMTAEEAKSQIQGRIVDLNTRDVYHTAFNPPIFHAGLTQNDIVDFIPDDDFGAQFPKTNKDLNGIENSIKKTGKVLLIPLFGFIGEMQAAIEGFMESLYATKEMERPFASFVRFQTRHQLAFSRLCSELYDLWNDKCLPMFGTDLSKLYKLIEQADLKIDYLRDQAKKAFGLIISRPDDRMAKSREFMSSENRDDGSELFHYVWQKSIEVRDRNLRKAEIHTRCCILKSLKDIIQESEHSIFSLILKRYFVVEWFTKNFTRQIDEQEFEEGVPLPEPSIPDFDVTNLRQLCELMDIQEYTLRTSCSRSTLPVPIPLQMESALMNRTQVYLKAKAPAKPAAGRPKRPPFASHISFDLPDDDPKASVGDFGRDSRQETIKKFLEYVKEEATPPMRKEAEVMIDVFDFFIEKKESIDKKINERVAELETTLEDMVRQKCSAEMENFSSSFRKMKRGEPIQGDLFVFDTSFLDRESKESYVTLEGQIPEETEIPELNPEKVKRLFLSLRGLKTPFVSLEQVIRMAVSCDFDEKERATLEVIAQIEALPDFIELGPFFERLAPVYTSLFQEPISDDELDGSGIGAGVDESQAINVKKADSLCKLEMAKLGSSRSSRASSRKGTARRTTSRRVSSATERKTTKAVKTGTRPSTSRKK